MLVDADPYGGAVAQQLGILDEVSGLLSAARLAAAGQLDERFASVQRASAPTSAWSPGCRAPTGGSRSRPAPVEHLLEVAREHGQVVVDTGFSLEDDPAPDFGSRPARNQMTLGALDVADEVVVVGAADPVGLSRLARGLVELRDLTAGAPVRVVVNRMRPTLGWSEKDIAGHGRGLHPARRPALPARGPGRRRPGAGRRPHRRRGGRLLAGPASPRSPTPSCPAYAAGDPARPATRSAPDRGPAGRERRSRRRASRQVKMAKF